MSTTLPALVGWGWMPYFPIRDIFEQEDAEGMPVNKDLHHSVEEYQYAELCLRARRFREAVRYGERVLEQEAGSNCPTGMVKALCLLARIHNAKGRYTNTPAPHEEALNYLHQGKALDVGGDVVTEFDLLLEEGKTLLLLRELPAAGEVFQHLEAYIHKKGIGADREVSLLLANSELCYQRHELEQATQIAQGALLISEQCDLDAHYLLEGYCQLARVYLRRQGYSHTLECGSKIVELARRLDDPEREFVGLNAIAVHYGNTQDFKSAMLHFRNALDVASQINYRYGIAHCLINIATIYAQLFNYDQALERYMTVLDDYEDVLDEHTGLVIMNNVGNMYFSIEKYDEALDYLRRAADLAENIQYMEMLAHVLAQISRTLVAKGTYEEAMDYALKSEELLKGFDQLEGRQINYITLGNIHYKLGNPDLALKYVSKGISAAKRFKDTMSELRGYRLMSNIFREKEDYKRALEYQLIYSQAQEQYAMSQRNRQIIDIEIQYDIQQKEQQIELLTKYQQTLISQRNKIADQNDKLRQSHTELKQFAYVVSHDLKEPLRMIGSYTRLIERRYQGQLDEDGDEFFGYVRDGVSRMNKLLDDLLKYATIGRSDDVDWEIVNLHEVLEITSFNLALAIEEAGGRIQVEGALPQITSSRPLILQLFQNLIGNAIKFRKPDVPPVITIRHKVVDNEHRISFSDNGIGIPEESQERIFVVFQRLHKRKDYQGTGIGLAICMKIVQKLQGSISVESSLGEGTTFTIGLPTEIPSAPPSPDELESLLDPLI